MIGQNKDKVHYSGGRNMLALYVHVMRVRKPDESRGRTMRAVISAGVEGTLGFSFGRRVDFRILLMRGAS